MIGMNQCLIGVVTFFYLFSNCLSASSTTTPSPKFTWTLITTIACQEVYEPPTILAYQSWQALTPAPDVIYISTCHPSFAKDASTITTFDRTVSGLPLFSDMMAISERVSTDLVAWTNADILITGDVVRAMGQLLTQPSSLIKGPLWMAVAARWDVPAGAVQSSVLLNKIKQKNLGEFLRREGVLHQQGEYVVGCRQTTLFVFFISCRCTYIVAVIKGLEKL